jgi:hypothetical protein
MPRNNDLFPWSIKNIETKYGYLLQKAQQQGKSKRRLHKKILVKVYFSLILLLALSTVVDLHVKLRGAHVKVEGHEEASLDVVIIHKL